VNQNINSNNTNTNTNNNHINNNNNLNISLNQYVKEYCKLGPPMKALEDYNLIKDAKKLVYTKEPIDIRFIRTLSDQYEFGKLPLYLGDIIISFYKKDKQNEQTFFTTDISRLTFLTKILPMGDTNIKWISDKSGELVKTHVIRPLLEYIEQSIIKFRKKNKVSIDNCEVHSNLVKISKGISNQTLENSIARYIAPKFIFNNLLIEN
jgi:hypothetical protein